MPPHLLLEGLPLTALLIPQPRQVLRQPRGLAAEQVLPPTPAERLG